MGQIYFAFLCVTEAVSCTEVWPMPRDFTKVLIIAGVGLFAFANAATIAFLADAFENDVLRWGFDGASFFKGFEGLVFPCADILDTADSTDATSLLDAEAVIFTSANA